MNAVPADRLEAESTLIKDGALSGTRTHGARSGDGRDHVHSGIALQAANQDSGSTFVLTPEVVARFEPSPALVRAFWARVIRRGPDECWLWTGAVVGKGYGHLTQRAGRKTVPYLAHRLAYMLATGRLIPAGMTIDHLCRNKPCVNARHLEVVTNAENNRRGFSPTAINARKTHCKRGHPFSESNTYRYRGMRWCRICRRLDCNLRRERIRLTRDVA